MRTKEDEFKIIKYEYDYDNGYKPKSVYTLQSIKNKWGCSCTGYAMRSYCKHEMWVRKIIASISEKTLLSLPGEVFYLKQDCGIELIDDFLNTLLLKHLRKSEVKNEGAETGQVQIRVRHNAEDNTSTISYNPF
jgi:hypothetical protein